MQMDIDQDIRDMDIFRSDHWKQNAKTIAEIASYENSTSQECLQTVPTGNHDIKSLSLGEGAHVLEYHVCISFA